MPKGFQPGDAWKGNRQGRPSVDRLLDPSSLKTNPEKKTREEIGKEELSRILKRLKPLSLKAIHTLGHMLESESATEASKLKAAVYLLDKYKEYMEDLYINAEDKDEEGDKKELEKAPVYSLKMINTDQTT